VHYFARKAFSRLNWKKACCLIPDYQFQLVSIHLFYLKIIRTEGKSEIWKNLNDEKESENHMTSGAKRQIVRRDLTVAIAAAIRVQVCYGEENNGKQWASYR
jgi:hypothetical protein